MRSKEKDLWQTVWFCFPNWGRRKEGRKHKCFIAHQNRTTSFLSSSSLSIPTSGFQRKKKKKSKKLPCFRFKTQSCLLGIRVCWLPHVGSHPAQGSNRSKSELSQHRLTEGGMLLHKLCQSCDLLLSSAVFQAPSPDNSISRIRTIKVI